MVGIGLLESPLQVQVKDGKLQSIQGADAEKVGFLLNNERNATLCELGIGTNYAARLTGVILEMRRPIRPCILPLEPTSDLAGRIKRTATSTESSKTPLSIWMICWF